MNAVPLLLLLPDGAARLIPGSFEHGQPRYERDGVALDVDVTLPPELEANWFWDGSFLRLRTEPGSCGVAIFTGTFGVPGVFDQAREQDRLRGELDAAARRAPARARRRQAAAAQSVALLQDVMELA